MYLLSIFLFYIFFAMKKLHALLVGINQKPLKFSEGNARKVESYLKTHLHPNYQLFCISLLGASATRSRIISNFEKMASSTLPGDVCLFYFAGHGKSMTVPKEFLRSEKDGFMEMIQCAPEGAGPNEILDKELSTLIYQVCMGKNIHFLALIDCCYAAGSTREFGLIPTDKMYGYAKYAPSYPPVSNHHHLAASRQDQKAGDGVYTECLLEALQSAGSSYTQIHDTTTRILTQKFSGKQTPVLSPTGSNLPFLNGAVRV